MDLFISWSGTKSKKIARVINEWLPSVIQAIKPYYSAEDIAKGKRWSQELGNQLNDSEYGLIILTKENIEAPWILFEAGALSKNLEVSRVCPIIFDIKETDVKGPLSEFQFTRFNKNELFKLVSDINELLGEDSLDRNVLEKVFNKMWDDFQEEIEEILESPERENQEDLREERDLLEEILSIVRKTRYRNLFRGDNQFERIIDKQLVSYDEETGYIIFWKNGKEQYSMSLDRLYSTGEILDWIFQVYKKRWCTPHHIYEFLNCIEELSHHYFDMNAQGIICPGGIHRHINWFEKKVENI